MHTCHFWARNEGIVSRLYFESTAKSNRNWSKYAFIHSFCLLHDWTLHRCHLHVIAGVSERLGGGGRKREVRVGRLGRVLAVDLMGRGWGTARIFTQRGVWLSFSACSQTDSHRLTHRAFSSALQLWPPQIMLQCSSTWDYCRTEPSCGAAADGLLFFLSLSLFYLDTGKK